MAQDTEKISLLVLKRLIYICGVCGLDAEGVGLLDLQVSIFPQPKQDPPSDTPCSTNNEIRHTNERNLANSLKKVYIIMFYF
jgi:hypothetical protein